MKGILHGFEAGLFDPERGNEVVEGEIFVDRRLVRFQSETVSEEIPVELLKIEMEPEGDRIYFIHADRPELKIFTSDWSVFEDPLFLQSNLVRSQVAAVVRPREMRRRVRLTLYFVLGCIVAGLIGSWISGIVVRAIAAGVPVKWEKEFGDSQLKELAKEIPLADDSNTVAQLTALAAPLVKAISDSRVEFKFHIAELPIPNAFALPGGHVIVTRGLLEVADQPEEILGVIAHEIGHVTKRHYYRHKIASAGPLVICGILLRSDNGLLDTLSKGSGFLIHQSFSQEYEIEADTAGWNYLVAANVNPRGMITMFHKFQLQDEEMSVRVPQAFSTHPATLKRIRRLESKWDRLPQPSGFLQLTNAIPGRDAGSLQKPRRLSPGR